MLIIFLGAPGSGKGTQAKILSPLLSFKHVSTGDMLREVSRSETDLGRELSGIMSRGELVTDDLVNKIVKETLTKSEYKNGCILDGYPRTYSQAKFLDQILDQEYKVIYFSLDKNKLLERIEGRYICRSCGAIYNQSTSKPKKEGVCDNCSGTEFEHRADDNAASLVKRVEVFEAESSEIINYYEQKEKLFLVKADQEVDQVTKQIVDAVKSN